jgi:hypothetical protein
MGVSSFYFKETVHSKLRGYQFEKYTNYATNNIETGVQAGLTLHRGRRLITFASVRFRVMQPVNFNLLKFGCIKICMNSFIIQ